MGSRRFQQRPGKTQALVVIADAEKSVFGPAIRAGAGMIVREIAPGIPIRAVIFAHCSPGALSEVRSPPLPVFIASFVFGEPLLFSRHRNGHSSDPSVGSSADGTDDPYAT